MKITNACIVGVLSDRETRTCHKEPIELSVYSVDQLLTRHMKGRSTREARKPSLDYVLVASFRHILTKESRGRKTRIS